MMKLLEVLDKANGYFFSESSTTTSIEEPSVMYPTINCSNVHVMSLSAVCTTMRITCSHMSCHCYCNLTIRAKTNRLNSLLFVIN